MVGRTLCLFYIFHSIGVEAESRKLIYRPFGPHVSCDLPPVPFGFYVVPHVSSSARRRRRRPRRRLDVHTPQKSASSRSCPLHAVLVAAPPPRLLLLSTLAEPRSPPCRTPTPRSSANVAARPRAAWPPDSRPRHVLPLFPLPRSPLRRAPPLTAAPGSARERARRRLTNRPGSHRPGPLGRARGLPLAPRQHRLRAYLL